MIHLKYNGEDFGHQIELLQLTIRPSKNFTHSQKRRRIARRRHRLPENLKNTAIAF
ncbi:hypothetical protein [Nostoc sp.]|uniref:hypothetical protein n=1 Tax=Nostoc sp. TaxID=1180 RepID=UPI002FF6339A